MGEREWLCIGKRGVCVFTVYSGERRHSGMKHLKQLRPPLLSVESKTVVILPPLSPRDF